LLLPSTYFLTNLPPEINRRRVARFFSVQHTKTGEKMKMHQSTRGSSLGSYDWDTKIPAKKGHFCQRYVTYCFNAHMYTLH
jgi:hypothetical protein